MHYEVRYVAHPGKVTMKKDGRVYWLTAKDLARRYEVGTCQTYSGFMKDYIVPEGRALVFIHLYPREDGDYKEYLQRILAAYDKKEGT